MDTHRLVRESRQGVSRALVETGSGMTAASRDERNKRDKNVR